MAMRQRRHRMRGSVKRWGVVAALGLGLAGSGGQSSLLAVVCAPVMTLMPFTSLGGPSGVAYHEPTDRFIVATTEAATFQTVHADVLGVKSPFSALAGLPAGIKLTTVRTGACLAGFVPGDVYASTGTPGGILRISGGVPTHPWVVLPGEPGIVTGLHQDRACSVGGDLVVVTSAGSVWRVTSAGAATLVVNVGRPLTGVVTLPNDPLRYGPIAGRIIAGDQDRIGVSGNGANGKLFAVDPSGDVRTVGAGAGQVPYPHYVPVSGASPFFNPADIDILPRPRAGMPTDGTVYAVDVAGGRLVTTNGGFILPSALECNGCGSLFLTQEYPVSGTSGFSVLLWDALAGRFQVEPVSDFGFMVPAVRWGHTAIRGGDECRVCTGQIGNFVWKDIDGDGLQDAGEPGIAGVKVTLTRPDVPGYSHSVFTDATGHYLFTGLCAGTYVVTVTPPPGDTFTTPNVGPDTAVDSNVNGSSVTLTTDASSDLTIDFGLKGPGIIGNLVWKDLNCDGIQDVGEPGLAGLTVHLKLGLNNAAGASIATTVTNGSGNYSFPNLNPGDYTVVVDGPAGFTQSPIAAGGVTVDSNGSPANVTLVAGSPVDDTIDFGYCAPPEFGRIIVQKITDPASDTSTVFSFTTTGSGYTPFTLTGGASHDSGDLLPGVYSVAEQTPPAGWTLVDASCDNGHTPGHIDLMANETVTCTFTNQKQATVIVKKVMVGGTGSFTFTGTPSGTVSADHGTISAEVPPGTHNSTEAAQPGWDLTSIVCDDSDSTGNLATRTATFMAEAGETVTCTFTNTRQATVIVKKVMVGGTASFDFSGTPAGTIAVNNGTISQTVAPGTYASTEAVLAGWSLTSIVCDDTNSTGSVGSRTATFNVEAGETVTCTFTNTKQSTVIVKKVMVGGTGSFTFTGT
ncbi:MAG: hypothetical protein FJW23_15025, partial [Acidimicrobiia bacterium]|nr:hypothetical protein [Acidimicrobiia bacterium]